MDETHGSITDDHGTWPSLHARALGNKKNTRVPPHVLLLHELPDPEVVLGIHLHIDAVILCLQLDPRVRLQHPARIRACLVMMSSHHPTQTLSHISYQP